MQGAAPADPTALAPTTPPPSPGSSMGSLTLTADPNLPLRAMANVVYSPSKSALNAITLAFALELESTRIKVNAVCPGYTATDINNFAGTRTVEEAAREPVRL